MFFQELAYFHLVATNFSAVSLVTVMPYRRFWDFKLASTNLYRFQISFLFLSKHD